MSSSWACSDCPITVHLHPDHDHESHAWTRNVISRHERIHTQQLEEHDGDRESLRNKLKHPARHAAIDARKAAELPHWPYEAGYNPPGGHQPPDETESP
jgi:hypothetical protein